MENVELTHFNQSVWWSLDKNVKADSLRELVLGASHKLELVDGYSDGFQHGLD